MPQPSTPQAPPAARPRARVTAPLLGAAALAMAAGCRAPSADAPTPPPVRLAVERYVGTPLSGPQPWAPDSAAAEAAAGDATAEPADAAAPDPVPTWRARARFGLSASAPPPALPLVATSASVVADASRADPIRSVPSAARAARIGPALAPGDERVLWLGAIEGLVAPAATTDLVARAARGTAPAVGLEFAVDAGGAPVWALAAADDDGAEDRLLLGVPPLSDAPATVWIPSTLGGALSTVVIEVSLEARPPAARAARAPAPDGPVAAPVDVDVTSALRAVLGERPRAALCLLAGELDVPVTTDVALIADEAFLANILAAAELADVASVGRAALAQRLERGTFLALAQLRGEGQLSLALDAVLLRHAGELGRLPSALADAVRESADRAALAARLVAENRLLLEDPDPAARRRALAWLRSRDAAPADFDPLADHPTRRAALRRDEERRALAAAEGDR